MIDPDLEVVARPGEGVAQLGQRLGPEGVADLGAVDRDLRDPVAELVEDVGVIALGVPVDRRVELLDRAGRPCGGGARRGLFPSMLLDNWLAQRAQTCPDRLALCGERTV